jgi:hypothetical protein
MPRRFERFDDALRKGMAHRRLDMPVEVPAGLLQELSE